MSNPHTSGQYYTSSATLKCSRMHLCIGTGKCQNYNSQNLKCKNCELRISGALNQIPQCVPIKGFVFEGANTPDLQESFAYIEGLKQVDPFQNEESRQSISEIGRTAESQLKLAKHTERIREELGKNQLVEHNDKGWAANEGD